jgi:hypothetical protein
MVMVHHTFSVQHRSFEYLYLALFKTRISLARSRFILNIDLIYCCTWVSSETTCHCSLLLLLLSCGVAMCCVYLDGCFWKLYCCVLLKISFMKLYNLFRRSDHKLLNAGNYTRVSIYSDEKE